MLSAHSVLMLNLLFAKMFFHFPHWYYVLAIMLAGLLPHSAALQSS